MQVNNQNSFINPINQNLSQFNNKNKANLSNKSIPNDSFSLQEKTKTEEKIKRKKDEEFYSYYMNSVLLPSLLL